MGKTALFFAVLFLKKLYFGMMTKERLSGIIIKMIRKVCRKGVFLLKKQLSQTSVLPKNFRILWKIV